MFRNWRPDVQTYLWQKCQLKTLKTVVKMMVCICPYWNLSLKSVHTACPSSSASSTDPMALQPTAQRKRILQLEVQGLITWNEEITALEKKRKLKHWTKNVHVR
jgi:hypothetical protein